MKLKKPAIYDLYEGEYPFNWSEALSEGVTAVIFRASYQAIGTRTRSTDSRAFDYVREAKANGIPCGLYHFLTPHGIAEQAALFCDVWFAANAIIPSALPPIVDVEINLSRYYPHATRKSESSIGNLAWQGHVKTFLDIVSARTGKTPMIYTSKNFWAYVCTKNGLTWQSPSWTNDYEFWIAQYFDQPDSYQSPNALPFGVNEWSLWQYSEKGRSNGFSANDLNVASPKFMSKYLNGVISETPDAPVADDSYVSAVFTTKSGKQETWLPQK